MSNSTEAPYFNVKVGNSNKNGQKTDGTDTVYCYVTTETVPLSVNSANYSQIYPSSTSSLVCSYNNTSVSVSDTNSANVNCIPQNATAAPVSDTSVAYCITPTVTTSGNNKSISCKYTTTAEPASNTFNC